MNEKEEDSNRLAHHENFEVEAKFRIEDVDIFRRRIQELGGSFQAEQRQVDEYFAHPVRDYAQTDEAFRIRTIDQHHWLTYKGPKIGTTTKTRREIEVATGQGESQRIQLVELFSALGFQSRAVVEKHREIGTLPFETVTITVCVDRVTKVGEFVELELIAISTEIEKCQQRLLRCARELELTCQERSSYLEMLLRGQK